MCGEIFKKSLRETHITDSFWWETRIPSDMCAGKHGSLGICVRETRIPRDMCAGNTLPGETYITMTADLTSVLNVQRGNAAPVMAKILSL